jgi:dihydrolipoamide dehydrogenase
MTNNYDIAIIGGGPGGYVAAIRASQLGLKAAVVEREHMGGICLNWGCIPTKAMLRSSEINHLLHTLDEYGLSAKDPSFDFDAIVKRSRNVSGQLTKGISTLMKKNKVDVHEAHGKLLGEGKVGLYDKEGKKTDELIAKNIIIATGARARVLPGFEPDGEQVWTYKEALLPKRMPKKLLVIGSGAIGSEFASFYQNMGAEVTLCELMDRILPVEDEEISAFVKKSFEGQGMKVFTGTQVMGIDKQKNKVVATIKGADGKETKQDFDTVISAVGIVGNTEGLNLEGTRVKVERNQIVTDEYGATDEPGIWAIGDVAGAPWLAHKASHEGIIAVEKIAGKKAHPIRQDNIPGCTYCRPQVASVGWTEAKAKEAGYDVKVGRFPFIGNGKAIALGEPEGMIKTIFDVKTGELLGAHMVGAEVTEMIQGFVLARQMEATEADLMHTIFPHPTLSEMMHESVLDAYGQVVHM